MAENSAAVTDAVVRAFVPTSLGTLHYRRIGQGDPLVLVHSAFRSSRQFLPTMQACAGRRATLALDLPGHGESDRPKRVCTVEDYATSLLEALDVLGVHRFDLLGQALGAYVAIEMGAVAPERVRRLVLVNSPFYLDRDDATKRHDRALETYEVDDEGFPIPRTIEAVLAHDRLHAPHHVTRAWLHAENIDLLLAGPRFAEALRATASYPLAAPLADVTSPVLLLWGSGFLYADRSHEYESRLADVRRLDVAGAGLFPQVDNLPAFVSAIDGFLGAAA